MPPYVVAVSEQMFSLEGHLFGSGEKLKKKIAKKKSIVSLQEHFQAAQFKHFRTFCTLIQPT